MPIVEALYSGLVGAAHALSPMFAHGGSKLARSIRGRRNVVSRLAEWSTTGRERGRRLIWFHAPSVGEGLQARAVMTAMLDRRADLQVVFTHSSPSAEGLARGMPAAAADYLPWDRAVDMDPVLDAIRPSLIVYTKTEIWPVLTRSARRRGIPTALVAATLPPGSSRLRWPTRSFLRRALARLSAVLAIAPEDAERFARSGARREVIGVTGDPGIDSAATRLGEASRDAPYLAPFHRDPRPTLVAGSTWPADEEVLLDALDEIRAAHPDVRLVIAPHEPTPDHLRPLEAALAAKGWSTARLGDVESRGAIGEASAIIVDRVGVLAHLYTVGGVAFVGGGFHGAGLHSVLEPAAAGRPTVFGPRHQGSRSAGDLLAAGGARVAGDAPELARVVRDWLTDVELRDRSGRAAQGYIEAHRGAASRTADRLLEIVGGQ